MDLNGCSYYVFEKTCSKQSIVYPQGRKKLITMIVKTSIKSLVLISFISMLIALFQNLEYEADIDNFELYPRVIGSKDAKPAQFPHQVSIQLFHQEKGILQHLCGGSIIHRQWILTAAHCTQIEKNHSLQDYIVRAGKHNLDAYESSEQASPIELIIQHGNYSHKIWKTLPYDIALIKLKNPLIFNLYVAPINLPEKDSDPTGAAIVSGWRASVDWPHATETIYPHILQTGKLKIIDRKECKKILKEMFHKRHHLRIDRTNICTGHLEGWANRYSDAGGPLIQYKNEKPELIGIVSWGIGTKPCGGKTGTTVYVRVASYIDWIEDIIYEI